MTSILGEDIGISFIKEDIVFDTDSDFKVTSGEDNLGQAIIMRILTKKGELHSHKSYGSYLYLLIGQAIDDNALNIASSYVFSALQDEPRISGINEVTVEFRQVDGKPTLVIFLKVATIDEDAELNLVINYNI